MKNNSAKCVKTAEYIADNPQFIVNGFVKAGICCTLDGMTLDNELDDMLHRMDSGNEAYTDSESSNDDLFADDEAVVINDSDSS